MDNENKIKITYDELNDAKVDQALAQQLSAKKRKDAIATLSIKWKNSFIYKKWLYLLLAGSFGLLLFWGLVTLSNSISTPKDRSIEIGNTKYLLSKEAQKYFTVYDVSDYEKTRSVIIIEEPHYSIEGQFSLYKGLEVFFKDNPSLINKTIFLSEGLPSDQPISVKPLVDVNSNPDENLIRNVLESFLITGYIAYEWKYQKNIPIVGIEDNNLYQLSARLWVEIQNDKNDQQVVALWNNTVVARNKSIANTLIVKTREYENPILFVGRLHLRKLSNDFGNSKPDSRNIPTIGSGELASLNGTDNLGIYDYLKNEKIGYTFLTAISKSESPKDIERNINRYTDLFKAQQKGDYGGYIRSLINEKNSIKTVTVSPSTQAAAQYVAASANNKYSDKGKKGKKDGKNADKENTPTTNPDDFEPVKGSKAKKNKKTGEIWEKDRFHKDHYEVYKNKKQWERGIRDRSVYEDGRLKEQF